MKVRRSSRLTWADAMGCADLAVLADRAARNAGSVAGRWSQRLIRIDPTVAVASLVVCHVLEPHTRRSAPRRKPRCGSALSPGNPAREAAGRSAGRSGQENMHQDLLRPRRFPLGRRLGPWWSPQATTLGRERGRPSCQGGIAGGMCRPSASWGPRGGGSEASRHGQRAERRELPMTEAAVRLAEAADHPLTLNTALFSLGRAHLRRGDLLCATPVLERSLDLCRTWQFRQ